MSEDWGRGVSEVSCCFFVSSIESKNAFSAEENRSRVPPSPPASSLLGVLAPIGLQANTGRLLSQKNANNLDGKEGGGLWKENEKQRSITKVPLLCVATNDDLFNIIITQISRFHSTE